MRPLSRAHALTALAVLAAPLLPPRSVAMLPPCRYQYAAKVVCGLRPFNDSLPQRFALAIDCRALVARNPKVPRPFFEGFVVIQSTLPLDVVGIYNVPGGVDVVPAAERQIYVGK